MCFSLPPLHFSLFLFLRRGGSSILCASSIISTFTSSLSSSFSPLATFFRFYFSSLLFLGDGQDPSDASWCSTFILNFLSFLLFSHLQTLHSLPGPSFYQKQNKGKTDKSWDGCISKPSFIDVSVYIFCHVALSALFSRVFFSQQCKNFLLYDTANHRLKKKRQPTMSTRKEELSNLPPTSFFFSRLFFASGHRPRPLEQRDRRPTRLRRPLSPRSRGCCSREHSSRVRSRIL